MKKLCLEYKSKIFIFIIFLILILTIIFASFSFKKVKKSKPKEENYFSYDNPNIRTFNLKGFEGTKMIWELFGNTAELNFDNDKNKIKIMSPILYFYNEENKLETEMRASNSIVDIHSNNVSAFGDVVLKTYKENATIFTDSVFYDKEKDLFYSDSFFKLEQMGNITEGIGFTSTKSLSEITIKKNVNIKYVAKTKQGV